MPNFSNEIRVMLAMSESFPLVEEISLTQAVHFAPWYRNQMRLDLGQGIRPLIEAEKDLDVRADYVPEPVAMDRYLNRGFGNSYDFNQTP
jgi:hypothetical protein